VRKSVQPQANARAKQTGTQTAERKMKRTIEQTSKRANVERTTARTVARTAGRTAGRTAERTAERTVGRMVERMAHQNCPTAQPQNARKVRQEGSGASWKEQSSAFTWFNPLGWLHCPWQLVTGRRRTDRAKSKRTNHSGNAGTHISAPSLLERQWAPHLLSCSPSWPLQACLLLAVVL
jgi:hypothetical protein